MQVKRRERIVLIGGGGHCKVVIDAALACGIFQIKGIVDPAINKGAEILGIPVLGGDDILGDIRDMGVEKVFVTVGSVGDVSVRRKLIEKAEKLGYGFATIIHPSAVIAGDVKIGQGTFVAAGVVINPGARIGENCIINTASSIDHDCVIGDLVHIAPGATLSGGVEIGGCTHIGTGAVVVNGVKIPQERFVRAGSLITSKTKIGTCRSKK